MAFFDLSALRAILTTETDADSPGSEELLSQFRENWEALAMLVFDTGVSGTVVSTSTATLTDTGNFAGVDVHNGHTLVITSGTAIGNTYTIDDTTVDTLVCTGDDLEADGVDTGDTYKVFYDLKVNTDAHSHDGVNSARIDVPINCMSDGETRSYGPTSGAESSIVYEHYFYKQAYHDTLYWEAQLYSTGLHTVYLDVYFGGAGPSTDSTAAGTYTVVSGSLDISGQSDGWNLVYYRIRTSQTDTVNARYFGSYII